jgi:hypothetical protein
MMTVAFFSVMLSVIILNVEAPFSVYQIISGEKHLGPI